MKRSLSDGSILQESNNTPVSRCNVGHKRHPTSAMSDRRHHTEDAQDISESTPLGSACGDDRSYSGLVLHFVHIFSGSPSFPIYFDV